MFEKATKRRARLRLAIVGPSGSGKTYTALKIATSLGRRVALIDTERGSASKYADEFDFDVWEFATFDPKLYIEAIQAAQQNGYDVLIIDSLSHAWAGTDGLLEQRDRAAKRYSGNTWAAWRDVTPLHNKLIDAMLGADLHIIAAMRSKTEYVVEQNDEGKMAPKKIGLAPVQRAGMEYEFDVVADMDLDHNFIVSKTRCPALDGATINKPDGELSAKLGAWLSEGAPPKQWIEDMSAVERFWDAAQGQLNLTPTEVLQALEVDDLTTFKGTKEEAWDKLKALAKSKQKQPALSDPQGSEAVGSAEDMLPTTALRTYLQETVAAASPTDQSDPASASMVRAVRSSLNKRYGEGMADRIVQAVFGAISVEEMTKAQAMAVQNTLGVNNGQWVEAVEAILNAPKEEAG